MKYILLALTMVMTFQFVEGQNYSTQWSEKNKDVDLSADVKGVLPFGDGVVLLTTEGKKDYAHQVDKQLNIVNQSELLIGKKESPIDFFSDGEKVFMFTNEFIKKDKQNVKRLYEFDTQSLQPTKKISEAKYYYNGKSSLSFTFRTFFNETELSHDKKWLSQVTENKGVKNESTTVSLFLAQRGDEVTANSGTISLPYTDKELEIIDSFVDNFGYISILGYTRPQANGENLLSVFTVMRNLKDFKEQKLSLKETEKFVGKAAIKGQADGTIYVGAFYNTKNNLWAEGTITYELNSKREIVQTLKHKIEGSDFLRSNQSNNKEDKALKQKKNGKAKTQKFLNFLNALPDNTGGVYLFAEQVKKYTVTNYNAISGSSNYRYFTDFDNLVITYIKNNEVKWSKVVPKHYGAFDGWHEYGTQGFTLDGENYLVYAAKTDKETLDEAEIESRTLRNIGLFMIKLNENGDFEPQVISGGKENVAMPLPGNFIKLNEHELFMIGKKAKGGVSKLLFGDYRYGKASLGKIVIE